nr:Melanoma-associated antigen D2 [Polyrhizophydium stewartii]
MRGHTWTQEVERKVADLVRYVLFMESSRTPIRRKDIVEKVLKEHSKGLPIFVQKTQETLRELFGMDLMLLPTRETKRSRGRAAGPAGAAAAAAQASSTSNAWVVLSTLTPQQREVALSMGQQDSRRMGLLSVILSLIFVSGRMLNEDVLFSYMKRLGVQRDGDHIHFGKIEGEMNNFVKLGYLERRRVRAPDGDTNSYVWGPRAKLEFSDARMVEFVTSGQYPAQAPYPAQQPYPPPPQAYPPPQQAYPAQPGYGQPAPGYGQPQQAYYPQQPPITPAAAPAAAMSAKVTRTPVLPLEIDPAMTVALPTGPSAQPGDHMVKISVSIEYFLSRGTNRKRYSADEYKRFYITYSLGGLVDGKACRLVPCDIARVTAADRRRTQTETFSIAGNNWAVTHDVNVTNDFIIGMYNRPSEFVIWEIMRTDEREREGVQSLTKRLPNMGITPLVMPGSSHNSKSHGGNGSGGGSGGGHGPIGAPKHGAGSHKFEFVGEKLPMSLAQTGLTRRHNHHLHKKHGNGGNGDDDDPSGIAPLGVEQIIEIDPNRPRPDAVFRSRLAAEADQRARERGDHLRIGQDFIDTILHRLTRRQSSSTPDLAAGLKQGVHEFKSLIKRTNSDSPPLDRFRPGSPLHRFLTDDFGVARGDGSNASNAGGGRSVSRVSNREGPHPHHYNHPEKHVSPEAVHRGLVRSRSSSSIHTETNQASKSDAMHPHKDGGTRGQDKGKARGRTKGATAVEDARHIRWDAHNAGIRAINWNELTQEEAERRANDQIIETPAEKVLLEKRKGEYTHVPLGKLTMDVTGFFFDVLEARVSVINAIEGLGKCDIAIRLDTPMLSVEQAARLNPMCITIGSADGMPSEPLSFAELDERCLPVSAKFRMYGDPFLHAATLVDQPRASRMIFDSQHLVLAGLLDAERLRDEIARTPFVIEIHDRDHKLPPDLSKVNADLRDDGIISSSLNPVNPFGVASFSLVDFCAGQTELQLSSPILPARANVTKSKRTLPGGLWLESSANLSINLHVRHPIVPKMTIERFSLARAPFGHIVIVASSRNSTLARVDILVGYDVFDGESRVIFIEGLVEGAIKALLASLERYRRLLITMHRVYHSPMITFNKPTYSRLSPVIMHVMLEPDLAVVLANKSTYIRGKLPRDAFDTLNLIHQMIDLESLSVQAKMTAFPTQRMILGLLGTFGRMVQFEESIPVGGFSASIGLLDEQRRGQPLNYAPGYHKKKDKTQLDIDNRETIKRMMERHLREPNFDKNTYYAYSRPFFSQMVEPVNLEEHNVAAEFESQQRWKTVKGFWAGPSLGVTEARREELKAAWQPPRPDNGMILRTMDH